MNTANLLKKHGIIPKKSLGQNFLTNESTAIQIAERSGITPDEIAIEIGAGTGILTLALSRISRMVIAYETDKRLVPVLKEVLSGIKNVRLVHEDFLKSPFLEEMNELHSYVSNIPYHLTSPIIERILFEDHFYNHAVLMVQKEFAERIMATSSTKSYGSLTVLLSAVCTVEKLLLLSRHSFYPVPNVDSVVLRLTPHENQKISKDELHKFRSLLKVSFSERRKMLKNNLKSIVRDPNGLLMRAGIANDVRAEELSVEDFLRLFRASREECF